MLTEDSNQNLENIGYLHIHRASSYAGYLRKIEIWMDGKPVDSLKNGEDKLIPLAPGSHTTIAKMAPGFSSDEIPVVISTGEVCHFELSAAKMRLRTLQRFKIIWLCMIPSFWLPSIYKYFMLPKSYTALTNIIFLFIFIIVLTFKSKADKKHNHSFLRGCLHYQPTELQQPEDKKQGMDWWPLLQMELWVLYMFFPCILLVFHGPWTPIIRQVSFPVINSIHALIGYFLTGWLFSKSTKDFQFKKEEN